MTLTTGQRFFEGFEYLRHCIAGHVHPSDLSLDHNPADAMTPYVRGRAVVLASMLWERRSAGTGRAPSGATPAPSTVGYGVPTDWPKQSSNTRCRGLSSRTRGALSPASVSTSMVER